MVIDFTSKTRFVGYGRSTFLGFAPRATFVYMFVCDIPNKQKTKQPGVERNCAARGHAISILNVCKYDNIIYEYIYLCTRVVSTKNTNLPNQEHTFRNMKTRNINIYYM